MVSLVVKDMYNYAQFKLLVTFTYNTLFMEIGRI